MKGFLVYYVTATLYLIAYCLPEYAAWTCYAPAWGLTIVIVATWINAAGQYLFDSFMKNQK